MSDVRANVYTMVGHDLDPSRKQGVIDGLDILGQYTGGISVAKTARVKLPTNPQGLVDTRRVGYRGMDPKVDLHIFVAPLAGKSSLLGAAYSGSGIAYIGSGIPGSVTGITTAHESAHSLGYVLGDSPQYDRANPGHCKDKCCIMKPEAAVLTDEQRQEFDEYKRFHEGLGLGYRVELNMPSNPEDFCTPCKADIRDTYQDHLGQLQAARFITGSITPAKQIVEMPLY